MRTHFLLCFMLFVASPATGTAKKPPPEPQPLPSTAAHEVPTLGLAENDCGLGESERMWTVNYLEPPGDVYYTLLRSEDCEVCGPGAPANVVDAAIVLEFQTPCTPSVTVSIVAAMGEGCRVPDPANVLCEPVEADLSGSRTGGIEFRAPLPECAFVGEAFLRVEFHELPAECAGVAQRPRLVTSGDCEPCAAYNHYPEHEDDLCELLFPGRPSMYVGTTGCGVVPIARASWGQLRSRYHD